MNPFIILMVFLLFVVASFWLIAKGRLVPRMDRLPPEESLRPHQLLQIFRYVGLAFLLPEAAVGNLPWAFACPAAIDDGLVFVFAFTALAALGSSRGMAVVRVFSIFGSMDLLYAVSAAVLTGAVNVAGGRVWWIPSLVVPAVIVSHVLIFRVLLQSAARPAQN